jgi:hypothetical protein
LRFGLLPLLACSVVALELSAVSASAEEAPAWMRQAASKETSAQGKHVPAIVLLDEQTVRVEENGTVVTTERHVVRVLSNEGRSAAVASVLYMTDTGKVRDMRAWLIRPSEEVRKYGKEAVLDVADPSDVFNDVRAKVISARDDVEPGAIFGYEWTTEDRSVFTQFDWQFQSNLPALASRFTIMLPAGWRAEGIVFNHPKIEPSVNRSSYTWEMRDLPFIYEEPAGPAVTNIAPRLAVSYFPPPGAKAGPGKAFGSWAEVSRWLWELSDPQTIVSEPIAAKARELTATAKTELDRIRAIGRYVQGVNYVSIQTGIGRGGGYRPHSSVDVFEKSYGDCKDKANLMRAMLKAVGIESHLVSIYSGDPSYVREEWPSPQQFNHCIIAVKVKDETDTPTVVTHPKLGRLLVFDPTDDNTPVGDLPDHEQGSLALIIAATGGSLLRMPVTPPEANRLERNASVILSADGSIVATLKERHAGQSAVSERRRLRGLSRSDYTKMIEGWITRGATGAAISKILPEDNSAEGCFALEVEFTAARYAQTMQGRLLVFKPAIVSRRESLILTEPVRKHPVILEPRAYSETVKVKLPEGFEVDELPDAVKLETQFGTYSTSYEVKEGHLHFTRKYVVRSATVPAGEYERVRGFFEKIREAEQTPVVLAKK